MNLVFFLFFNFNPYRKIKLKNFFYNLNFYFFSILDNKFDKNK